MTHAQGNRGNVGIWIVSALLLILLLAAGSRVLLKQEQDSHQRTVTVRRGDIRTVITAGGSVIPHIRTGVRPPIACRVDEVLAGEGQRVQRDQVVARISSPERAAILSSARLKGESELRKWEEIYKAIPVTAPIAGTVLSCSARVGQMLSPDMEILAISDYLVVKAYVDETDVGAAVTGRIAEVRLDAYPGSAFAAPIAYVASEARVLNGVNTYEVLLGMTNWPRTVRSGMTASVALTTATRNGVLILPRSALANENGETVVYAVTDRQQATARRVRTGLRQGDDVEITDGLREGESVLAVAADAALETHSRRPSAGPLLPAFTGRPRG